jgi:hypothetical protein
MECTMSLRKRIAAHKGAMVKLKVEVRRERVGAARKAPGEVQWLPHSGCES